MCVGKKIVQTITKHAKETGSKRIYLVSQIHAMSFYTKLGFEPYGDKYMEAGIEHIKMQMLCE